MYIVVKPSTIESFILLLYTDWRRKDTSGQNEETPYHSGGRGDHRPTSTVPDPKQQNRHSYSEKYKGKSRQKNRHSDTITFLY